MQECKSAKFDESVLTGKDENEEKNEMKAYYTTELGA